MRICTVHNEYRQPSGEEVVVRGTERLLRAAGHEVIPVTRRSAEIACRRLGRFRAGFSGIYSAESRRQIRRLLRQARPDIVHVHNLFPLISPSILPECREQAIPVVMTVHNYRLVCPNGMMMTGGQVCERCCGGREYWCLLRNCEGHLLKNAAHALRNYVARTRRLFLDNVTLYVPVSEFQRPSLIRAGFPPDRITVIPNMVDPQGIDASANLGDVVAYVGRVRPEKGVLILMKAAARCAEIPFRAAGSLETLPQLPGGAPQNLQFVGFLEGAALHAFYRNARMVVLPSVWHETFGLPLVEAGLHGKPVICSRIGGMPEIVEDGVSGLLVEPGNADDLADKIQHLWARPDLCREMGRAGRRKALREYSPERYYDRLMAVYEKALALGPGGPVH